MPPPVLASKGMTVSLLSEVTTGTGTGIVIPSTAKGCRVTVHGSGTISAGTMIIEEANVYDYAGLWSEIETVDLTALTGNDKQVIHIDTNIGAVRARIGTSVAGGGNASAEVVSY